MFSTPSIPCQFHAALSQLCLLLGVARPGERPEDSELNLEGIDDKEIEMVSKTHPFSLHGHYEFYMFF